MPMREFVELIMGLTGFVAPQLDRPLSEVACIGQQLYDPNKKVPLMTPVLLDSQGLKRASIKKSYSKDSLEWLSGKGNKGQQMHAKILFPPNPTFKSNYQITVVSDRVHVMDPKMLLDGHRVKNIDEFETSKISKIADFVKEQGVLSLRMEDPTVATKFMKNLNCFAKAYKKTVFMGHNHPGNESPKSSNVDDLLVTYATFLDLPYAIPIYNRKKVDGMGIRIGMYWPASSHSMGGMHASDEACVALSQYADNLLVVDGAIVNKSGYIGSDYISHFCKKLEREVQRRKDLPNLKKKAKENAKKQQSEIKKMKAQMTNKGKPARRSDRMTAIKIDTSGTSSSWGSNSASTTTGTYYTTS
jgi:hypothetical protein